MGHIDHLRTQYQSNITFTHSFNNTITLREKVIFSILRNKYINTEVPFTKGWFVTKLVKIAPVILEKKCFLISLKYFHYFVMIFPWKRAWSIIWTNLNPLHPRMLSAKFGWNWPSGSGEEGENVKRFQRRRRTTDKFEFKNSLEPSAQMS